MQAYTRVDVASAKSLRDMARTYLVAGLLAASRSITFQSGAMFVVVSYER
jgi:hypothetical protein